MKTYIYTKQTVMTVDKVTVPAWYAWVNIEGCFINRFGGYATAQFKEDAIANATKMHKLNIDKLEESELINKYGAL